ncbi:MAG: T3SS (YopN, CesT) and YbjN peptide-binding chaperone 1, partial [Cyanobium sp.]
MANPSGPSKLELLVVAKQAVAECCSIQPEDVHVDEDGCISIDHSVSATCPLFIHVDDEPNPCFIFQANLLRAIQVSAKLYRLVNEINLDLTVGQVYYEEGCINYFYKLPTRAPSSQLIAWIIRRITELIDEYDDTLQQALGGLRWTDEDPEDPVFLDEDANQSLEELMLRDIDEASNECNRIMMRIIASYLCEEDISEYAESDDNDKAFVLEQLDRMLHCGLDQ